MEGTYADCVAFLEAAAERRGFPIRDEHRGIAFRHDRAWRGMYIKNENHIFRVS